jgi:hypothetical protein
MNSQVQRALQERIESFASDITKILQDAVADAVADTLGSAGASRARKGRAALPARASKKTDAAGRRTREHVQEEADALLKEIQRKGDRRIEEIAKSMRRSTKVLVTPMKKLLDAKTVKKSGVARGTTYRAASRQ